MTCANPVSQPKILPIGVCQLCHRGIAGIKSLQLPCVHNFHHACFAKYKNCQCCPVCTVKISTSSKTRGLRVSRARKITKKAFTPCLQPIPEDPVAVKPVRELERKVMYAFAFQFPPKQVASYSTDELLDMVTTELHSGFRQTNPTKAFIHGLYACWLLRHFPEKTHQNWTHLANTTTLFIDKCRSKLNFIMQ
uniref:RING-type domain-containing protein n=1 Tax=Panagrellus redivivus TaxID=6233 RepID=A0A7E4VG21_PANRE